MLRDVYSGTLRLHGEEHRETLRAAVCYASSLIDLQRHAEAKLLMREAIPVARRVVDESDILMLTMRTNYAMALCNEPSATLDDIREAVTTLEETVQTAARARRRAPACRNDCWRFRTRAGRARRPRRY